MSGGNTKNHLKHSGAALTANELAILYNKYQMHGHFKVDENTIFPSTSTSSLPPFTNFMDKEKYSSSQYHRNLNHSNIMCDLKKEETNQLKRIHNNFGIQIPSGYHDNMHNSLGYQTITGVLPDKILEPSVEKTYDMPHELISDYYNYQPLNNFHDVLDDFINYNNGYTEPNNSQ